MDKYTDLVHRLAICYRKHRFIAAAICSIEDYTPKHEEGDEAKAVLVEFLTNLSRDVSDYERNFKHRSML